MKKVLFVTSYTPSKYSAGQNFTLNLLEDLGRHHSIDVVYFQYRDQVYTPPSENIRIQKMIPVTIWSRLRNFILCPFFHPIFSIRFSLSTLFFLRSLMNKNKYDIVCFDFSQVFLYSFFFKTGPVVLIAHDVLFQKFKRQGTLLERGWIYLTERMIFRQKNIRVYSFSEKDRDLIRQYGQNGSSSVVNFYLSSKILEHDIGLSVDDFFCFFAAWNRPENHEGLRWFFREVLPHTGKCRFVILGASMPEDLVQSIAESESVEYMGFVEDPYAVIARSRALIAPLFKGAGVKVKVIESLACGTQVIGTSVALEGIPEVTNDSLFECNTSEEFISVITNFTVIPGHKSTLRKSFLEFYRDENRRIVL